MNDKSKPADKKGSQALGELTESNLDTVRDILFGAQVRETNQKNQDLEHLIKQTSEKLEKEFNSKVQSIETSIAKLVESLAKQAEQTAVEVANQFKDTQSDLQTLEKNTKASESDMFDELTAERQALESRATGWNEDLAKQLETIHQQLLHSKTDRVTLANLLSGMAESLAPEAQNSTSKKK